MNWTNFDTVRARQKRFCRDLIDAKFHKLRVVHWPAKGLPRMRENCSAIQLSFRYTGTRRKSLDSVENATSLGNHIRRRMKWNGFTMKRTTIASIRTTGSRLHHTILTVLHFLFIRGFHCFCAISKGFSYDFIRDHEWSRMKITFRNFTKAISWFLIHAARHTMNAVIFKILCWNNCCTGKALRRDA